MKALTITFVFLVTVCTAAAQDSEPHVTEPMRALDFLVGNWEGKAKYDQGAGFQHQEVLWTKHVYYNSGGSILLIDERGNDKENRDRITQEVLVVVYWDPAANEYSARLHWSIKDGADSGEGKVNVQDNTIVFLTESPNALRRYTIRVDEEGQWDEVGEISRDGGESWNQIFEITLNRQN